MKHYTRILALLLALMLTLSACSQGGSSAGESSGTSSAASGETAEEGETGGPILDLPLTTEDVTFTMFISGLDNLTSSFALEDNDFTRKIYEDTGIKLEFIACSPAEKNDKLSVLLNSGDYPDLIRDNYMSLNDIQYYADQDIFISLDEYNLMEYPNIAAAYEEFPELDEALRGSDGKLYTLPEVNDCLHNTYRGGRMHYYMPWFRDNDIEVPETLDEFTEYLRWVKTSDPNGNGEQDEIPFAFWNDESVIKNAISALAKPFLPWIQTDKDWGLAVVDGKVTEQYRTEEFRDALRYMNMLYEEGLILENSFSISQDELRAIGDDPDGPMIAVVAAFGADGAVQKGTARWAEYFFLMPPLEGPNGDKWAPNKDPWNIFYPGMMVTDRCSDPNLAVALYNYMIDFEVSMDGYIGPKGEAWDDPDSDGVSLRGDEAKYKLLVNYGTQRVNSSWNQYNPMMRNSDFRLGEQAQDYETALEWLETGNPDLLEQVYTNPSFNEIANYNTALPLMEYAIPDEYFLPPMALSDEDNTRVADIKAMLDPYKLQVFAEFITGTRDIETDWDAYLAELDAMGSPEMVEILQRNYDSKNQ